MEKQMSTRQHIQHIQKTQNGDAIRDESLGLLNNAGVLSHCTEIAHQMRWQKKATKAGVEFM